MLHALYAAGALLLVVGGAFKLVDPSGTVGALRAFGVPLGAGTVRSIAGAELVIGAAALVESSRFVAVLVAITYVVFAAFTVVALVRDIPIDTCGCLGRLETPPSWRHLVVIAVVLVSAAAEVVDPADAFLQQLGDDADDVVSAVVAVGLCAIAILLMRAGRRPSTPR